METIQMDRLNGGRGEYRVGSTVTPRKEFAGVKYKWTELTIDKFLPGEGVTEKDALWLKQPDGMFTLGHPSELLLTSSSELQALAQLESIREMVAALRAARKNEENDTEENAADAEEKAREAIQQDPLSVEVRSGWMTLDEFTVKQPPRGDYTDIEGPKAAEFKILLCTGGPAVQIIGELSEHSEPEKPRLQHQDWGTPWTDVRLSAEDEETLLEYCACFYFGE